jgi:hypothetical protein
MRRFGVSEKLDRMGMNSGKYRMNLSNILSVSAILSTLIVPVVILNHKQALASFEKEKMACLDVREKCLLLKQTMENVRVFHSRIESQKYSDDLIEGLNIIYEKESSDLDGCYRKLEKSCLSARILIGVDFDDALFMSSRLIGEYKRAFQAYKYAKYEWGPLRAQYPENVWEFVIRNNNQYPDNTVLRINEVFNVFEAKIRPFVKDKKWWQIW